MEDVSATGYILFFYACKKNCLSYNIGEALYVIGMDSVNACTTRYSYLTRN